MNKTTSIAALALASTLTLLATGCDRRDEATPGGRGDNTSMGAGDRTAGDQMSSADTAPMTSSPDMTTEGNAGSTGQTMGDAGQTTMGGAGQAMDDAGITAAVKGRYLVDDTLKGLDISVDTEQGVVRLTGNVQSQEAKEQATRIAQGVDGVVNVDNQLNVRAQR